MRDKTTGISMGFGFVNYEENGAALAAVDALNGKELREGKRMKVSVARPAWKANIHSNLYMSGFLPAFGESELLDLLGIHAKNVENVRLLRDSDKKPRGAAVVRMSSEEAASTVISAMDGIPYTKGAITTVLQVRPWRPEFRADRVSDENLSGSLSVNRMDRIIAQPVISGKGFAMAAPPPMIDAQRLLKQMASSYQRNNSGLLPLPTTTPENYETEDEVDMLATLFIFHLPKDIPEETLGRLFSQYGGQIESVQIMKNKCYGFVSYYRTADAVMAMGQLEGFIFPGSHKPIRIELKH